MQINRPSEDTLHRELAATLPVTGWLPAYTRKLFRADIIAGITLTAFAIPELMAYAQLAGLPPEYGLYAGIVAPLVYCIFGTIREMNIGPSSSEAILTAAMLGTLVGVDAARYASLAALTALMAGSFAILARIAKLGFIVNLISETVLKGFLAGMGMVIICGQLFKIFGIESVQGAFFDQLTYLITNLPHANLPTVVIGVGAIAFLICAEHRCRRLPAALIVVIISILLMTYTDLAERGVQEVGVIPAGLPGLVIPGLSFADLQFIFPLAFAIFLLAYVEGMSIGTSLARRYHYKVDANQELLALGATSIATSLFQGFPVAGSFSRTALNEINGAATQITGVIAAVLTAIVAMFLTGLFTKMPEAIIGSLILVAVLRLIDVRGLLRIARISRDEFAIAIATCAGVLLFGILSGVFLGVILSLTDILYRVTSPRIAVLGKVPDTRQYADRIKHPENEAIPGVLIVRVDAPLIFANAEIVKERIGELIAEDPTVRLVLLDMSTSPIVDVSASDMIVDLCQELTTAGIKIRIADATWQVRRMLRISGVEETIGEEVTQTTSLETVLSDWNCTASVTPVCPLPGADTLPDQK
ncbi:SulP family inorganic anion transporter [uncultured Methanospirillum sp.]|uniref:SulP family inorganic anion transporter n=1 Tax=uncultured Methanospirillum sp. TaxID=262503 RepID=UPI0029C7351C|nr:SulP family inorganic anion transporter [uncultured Methanospirillum sp.]